MAFASSKVSGYPKFMGRKGEKKIKYTYTNGATDTGGNIVTPFKVIREVYLTTTATTGNEALYSVSGGILTLTTPANMDGDVVVIGW